MEQSEIKPFQVENNIKIKIKKDLIFLVRDWPFPYEYNYGDNEDYLNTILKNIENKPMELQKVRQHIKECFEDIKCILLPHPGKKVSSTKRFVGNIDGTFYKKNNF